MHGENEFCERLHCFRRKLSVSAREMSLSLGQNESYINNIERGRALPSMHLFFCICDYLHITPYDFFESEDSFPLRLRLLVKDIKRLKKRDIEQVDTLIKRMIHIEKKIYLPF